MRCAVPCCADAYLTVSGLLNGDGGGLSHQRDRPGEEDDELEEDAEMRAGYGARRTFVLAQEMLRVCSETQAPDGSGPIKIRIGLHVGPVVAAVVGTRMLRCAPHCLPCHE